MTQDLGLAARAMARISNDIPYWKTVVWLPFLMLWAGFMATHVWASPVMQAALNTLLACVYAGLIAVQLHRFNMLQEKPVSISFTARGSLWCYAWRWLLFWAVALVPALFAMARGLKAEPWTILDMDQGLGPAPFGLAVFVSAMAVFPLSLTLASTAARYEKISLGRSLRRTAPLLPGIAGAALVLAVVMALGVWLTAPLAGHAVTGPLRAVTLLTLFVMVETSILSEIYARVGPLTVPVPRANQSRVSPL